MGIQIIQIFHQHVWWMWVFDACPQGFDQDQLSPRPQDTSHFSQSLLQRRLPIFPDVYGGVTKAPSSEDDIGGIRGEGQTRVGFQTEPPIPLWKTFQLVFGKNQHVMGDISRDQFINKRSDQDAHPPGARAQFNDCLAAERVDFQNSRQEIVLIILPRDEDVVTFRFALVDLF